MAQHDQQKLEAIRRQLDVEFGDPSERATLSRHAGRAAGGAEGTRVKPPRDRDRGRKAGAVFSGLVLVAFAVGGGAGAAVVLLYTSHRGAPASTSTDRTGPASRSEAMVPSRTDRAPATRSAPDVRLPPRATPGGIERDAKPSPLPSAPPNDEVPATALYYYDGRYFRYAGGQWFVAGRRQGPWERMEPADVPQTLRALPGVYRTMPDDMEESVPRAEQGAG